MIDVDLGLKGVGEVDVPTKFEPQFGSHDGTISISQMWSF